MKAVTFALAMLLMPLCAGAVTIQEWVVPWPDTRPRDPSVAPDGKVWFVGQGGNYLARFDPAKQSFDRFDLPPETRPHTVLVDPDGQPWVAGNGNGTILRYGPDGALRETYAVPETEGIATRDPHTFAFDHRGGMWFTMQQGNAIGHLDMKSGQMRLARVATPQARPYGVVVKGSGDAWVVLFAVAKLARISRKDMAITEVDLPRPLSRPRRLAIEASGAVWYVDFAQGYVGRHDPSTGKTQEWPAPSKPSAPYAMAIDANDRPWFFESAPQPNLLWRIDAATGEFADRTPVPAGGGTVRHMEFDPRCNCLWFGTDANTLGRAKLAP